jgi:hypothetical protein
MTRGKARSRARARETLIVRRRTNGQQERHAEQKIGEAAAGGDHVSVLVQQILPRAYRQSGFPQEQAAAHGHPFPCRRGSSPPSDSKAADDGDDGAAEAKKIRHGHPLRGETISSQGMQDKEERYQRDRLFHGVLYSVHSPSPEQCDFDMRSRLDLSAAKRATRTSNRSRQWRSRSMTNSTKARFRRHFLSEM